MKKFRMAAAFLAAFVVGAPTLSRIEARSARSARTPGNHELSFRSGGYKRTCIVHVPADDDGTAPIPVVLVIHGGGGNIKAMEAMTGFDSISDKHGFLAVYPQGVGPNIFGKVLGTWNAGACCGKAMDKQVDDVGFFSELIDRLVKEYGADSRRVYATGLSNGSQMSFRLACELPGKIAAIGPVAAQGVLDSCAPSKPVPVIYFHGTADPCSPYSGGTAGGCFEKFLTGPFGGHRKPHTWPVEPVPQYIARWVRWNGISSGESKTTYRKGAAMCQTWGSGLPGETVLCTIDGMGHAWPGGGYGPICDNPSSNRCRKYRETVGPGSDDINAGEAMWEFFERHGPASRR